MLLAEGVALGEFGFVAEEGDVEGVDDGGWVGAEAAPAVDVAEGGLFCTFGGWGRGSFLGGFAVRARVLAHFGGFSFGLGGMEVGFCFFERGDGVGGCCGGDLRGEGGVESGVEVVEGLRGKDDVFTAEGKGSGHDVCGKL